MTKSTLNFCFVVGFTTFAFAKGLQRGFVLRLEVYLFRANLGIFNVALGQNTYSRATVILQSHLLLLVHDLQIFL